MKPKRAEGLNIVPFIDVMLVLLAIVLSVSTFIAQGKIPINLPQADNIDKKLDDKVVHIVISRGESLSISTMSHRIKTAYASVSTLSTMKL